MHLRHGDCSKYVHGICTLIIGTDVRCIAYAMRKFKTQTI
jgi:predicted MarR family transcription regulator